METVTELLGLAKVIGRHSGTCTTFERAAAEWRDRDTLYIGVKLEDLTRFGDIVLVPEFAKWLHHPEKKVRTLALAAVRLAQHPLDRTFGWKWRDFWASGGARTVPVPYQLAYKFIQARSALERQQAAINA